MRTLLTVVASLMVLAVAPAARGLRCDPSSVESDIAAAERAERRHAIGEAIRLRTELMACPRGDQSTDNQLALARDHASVGDYARAAELVEDAAAWSPDVTRTVAAMHEVVGYRIALGDLVRARADATWLTGPGRATPEAFDRAFEVGAALEDARQWTDAARWYRRISTRFSTREQWSVQARALTGLGRALAALGDAAGATRSWEAAVAQSNTARETGAVARAVTAPRRPPLPARPSRPPRGEGPAHPTEGDAIGYGAHPGATVGNGLAGRVPEPALAVFAEAQFRLAASVAAECARQPAPAFVGQSRAAYDAWVTDRFVPYLLFRSACIDTVARALFSMDVQAPHWQIARAALLGEQNLAMVRVLRERPLPPDLARNPDLIEVYRGQM